MTTARGELGKSLVRASEVARLLRAAGRGGPNPEKSGGLAQVRGGIRVFTIIATLPDARYRWEDAHDTLTAIRLHSGVDRLARPRRAREVGDGSGFGVPDASDRAGEILRGAGPVRRLRREDRGRDGDPLPRAGSPGTRCLRPATADPG